MRRALCFDVFGAPLRGEGGLRPPSPPAGRPPASQTGSVALPRQLPMPNTFEKTARLAHWHWARQRQPSVCVVGLETRGVKGGGAHPRREAAFQRTKQSRE